MRHKAKANKPSSSLGKPSEKSGDEKEKFPEENGGQTRPLSGVGTQETAWMDAKWLALADQALSD